MSEESNAKDDGEDRLDMIAGLAVVIVATFLGICNVKDGNIVQNMQIKKTKENDTWSWYQARKIRSDVQKSTAIQLSLSRTNETEAERNARETLVQIYEAKSKEQIVGEDGADELFAKAKAIEKEYEILGKKDDQFDLSEASLSIGLALFGVTILMKKWWMFIVAMIPSTFGVFMGLAGFIDLPTADIPLISTMVELLT